MTTQPEEICSNIRSSLVRSGLFPANGDGKGGWWIAPEPYLLSRADFEFFTRLGHHLLKFYQVINRFYFDGLKEKPWFAEYLDLGKPSDLLDYGRMNRFKRQLPGILRPDVIVTEDGFAVTELDSVPGGFGLLAQLMTLYQTTHQDIVGADQGGIADCFYGMIESTAGSRQCTLAIVVSAEAEDYLEEMKYLGNLLRENGLPVFVVRPREIIFKEDGLFLQVEGREVKIDVVYRFFELFDLKNIPKSELLLYSNKKGQVKTTPPYKTYLEEKLIFALFHHPSLTSSWKKALGDETFTVLSHLIPDTWILDNRALPPYGVIPGLEIGGAPVNEWKELYSLTQKERELVVKTSGFSPLSWGSRGVTIGHDVSAADWARVLSESLENFEKQPSVLQKFHKGKRVKASYLNPATQTLEEIECRVRLTPYYFIVEEAPRLGGILATLCPKDKKKIHGMTDAIMVPCAVEK